MIELKEGITGEQQALETSVRHGPVEVEIRSQMSDAVMDLLEGLADAEEQQEALAQKE